MDLSVVVPTLNARARLVRCLDALGAGTPGSTEVIVVNGPSSDGTSGAIRERDDVSVLVEIAERNRNVARNAGIEVASGDVVALLSDRVRVTEGWYDAIESGIAAGTDAVTGPVGAAGPGDTGRTPALSAGNLAVRRSVLEALDGFDEFLRTGGASDLAHRLANAEYGVTWSPSMRVSPLEDGTGPARPSRHRDTGYLLAKNHGVRPRVLRSVAGRLARGCLRGARAVLHGDIRPTDAIRSGRSALGGVARGLWAGLRARAADSGPRRNPNGISTRRDRAVQRESFA